MSVFNTEPENLFLKKMHDLTLQNEVDLHTYFYMKDFMACPICNEWLVMRGKPPLESKSEDK